jgi:hypothetical protein
MPEQDMVDRSRFFEIDRRETAQSRIAPAVIFFFFTTDFDAREDCRSTESLCRAPIGRSLWEQTNRSFLSQQ